MTAPKSLAIFCIHVIVLSLQANNLRGLLRVTAFPSVGYVAIQGVCTNQCEGGDGKETQSGGFESVRQS